MATGDLLTCFMLIETDTIRRSLRRYCSGSQCTSSGMGYHDAMNEIEPAQEPRGSFTPSYEYPEDPRWPVICSCGYAFQDQDMRQVFAERLFKRSDTGAVTTFRDAPPGAFAWADYLRDSPGSIYHGERGGGPHLFLRCPAGGWWDLDSKASNGPGWRWSGSPPVVTAQPSIDMNGAYHGILTDGVLREC